MPKAATFRSIALGAFAFIGALAAIGAGSRAQETPRPAGAQGALDKAWRAVAPGRVEPVSGEIRIGTPLNGRVTAVLVKANDKVVAGEPLIRLDDSEARARLAVAEAQVNFRKRLRNDQAAGKAAERRRAEDAVADAERAVLEARAAVDSAAAARRTGGGSGDDLEKVGVALANAQTRLTQRKSDLRIVELDAPLPSLNEGQLAVARAEYIVAATTIDRMTIRTPIAGTVLQVNARPGEIASASATQPLAIIGDISALRVRTELDERDFAQIKVGQGVAVRANAFGGREFAGKVASIAPIVEASSINARGLRTLTDINVMEVMVDLTDPGPLMVGMRVDVFFRADNP
jgi:HlyD family secretion protein